MTEVRAGSRRAQRRTVTGHYAGSITRAAGAAIDTGVVMGTYTAMLWAAGLLMDAFFPDASLDHGGIVAASALSLWAFVYTFTCLAVAGQTVGKAVLGSRVVDKDGSTLSVRQAFVRTLVSPLSALLFGFGLLLIVVHPAHRALHDLIAGTAVVYDWGSRSAQLPGPLSQFLARNTAQP